MKINYLVLTRLTYQVRGRWRTREIWWYPKAETIKEALATTADHFYKRYQMQSFDTLLVLSRVPDRREYMIELLGTDVRFPKRFPLAEAPSRDRYQNFLLTAQKAGYQENHLLYGMSLGDVLSGLADLLERPDLQKEVVRLLFSLEEDPAVFVWFMDALQRHYSAEPHLFKDFAEMEKGLHHVLGRIATLLYT